MYTTYNNIDIANYEMYRAKVGKDVIGVIKRAWAAISWG